MGGVVEIVAADAVGLTPDALQEGMDYALANAFALVNPAGDYIVKNFDLPSGNLLTLESNIVGGVAANSVGLISGAATGDWVQFRDSLRGLTSATVGVIAVVVGFLIGWFLTPAVGYPIMAAGFTLLDAQYNNGDTLKKDIALKAMVEKATTGTSYIEKYAVEIQSLVTLAASVVASYGMSYGMSYMGVTSAVQPYVEDWRNMIGAMNMGYGGYQIYSAIQAILDSQAYWKAKLEEAEAYLRKVVAQAQGARDMWFTMMTDYDLVNRIQAGGDLFVQGAGHALFSMTNVAEPKYALGLVDTSDADMDRLINNRYYNGYAGNDSFKIK